MTEPHSAAGTAGPVTITDVAAAAQVSIRTVSRVLNGSSKVGEDTRERIKAAIERMGFHPNSRARGLAAGRSYLIGVVQDDPNAHVIGVLQRGIAQVCSTHGYELVVHPARYGDPDIVDNVTAFVRRSKVDGLLLLPPLSELSGLAEALAAIGVPAVALAATRTASHPAMVMSTEREAAADVARHLLALGHRRIATVTGPLRFCSARERRDGFVQALREAGVELAPGHLCEGDYGFASGVAAGERMLSGVDRPTAVFAANDIMAAAVIKVATERGLSVPRDLSVGGFDDSDIAGMITPTLTTIRRPIENMAAAATRQLLRLVTRDGDPDDITFDLELIVRQSTAAPSD
jgi:LacI family transcriptional regulator